jgi:8-hydroxy-5-deazaflavin:NADPH oxidoreductase
VRIGVIGAGRIGGNIARLLARAGHEVALSFARDPKRLEELAVEIGERAQVLPQAEAAQFGDVVVLSVPWSVIDDALEQAGSLAARSSSTRPTSSGRTGWSSSPTVSRQLR